MSFKRPSRQSKGILSHKRSSNPEGVPKLESPGQGAFQAITNIKKSLRSYPPKDNIYLTPAVYNHSRPNATMGSDHFVAFLADERRRLEKCNKVV